MQLVHVISIEWLKFMLISLCFNGELIWKDYSMNSYLYVIGE